MKIDFLNEPKLEFGAGEHIDIRFGLSNYYPLDFSNSARPKQINLGIVGTSETIEGLEDWLERCRQEIPAKQSRQPNLFSYFPGFNQDECFMSSLVINSKLKQTISQKDINSLISQKNRRELINKSVETFTDGISYLAQNSNSDVIVCAIPFNLAKKLLSEEVEDLEDERIKKEKDVKHDFHDVLKSRAMSVKKPIQLVLPSTYDEAKKIFQKRRTGNIKQRQDEATRAWNFHTALYYKAGGIPWRLVRSSEDYTACYLGISFYRSVIVSGKSDSFRMLTSVAEVFNERGQGIIIRGGEAELYDEDRSPHLSENDAFNLLNIALESYRKEHKTLPARIVLHKTSKYYEQELRGFESAAKANHVDLIDFITIEKSFTRLFRKGAYPTLRGTYLNIDDNKNLLYTRGSVDFFQTYPGMYVPKPLAFVCEHTEQTPRFLAKEILALTKMNWNNTQFDNSYPITIEASRRVGNILKYVSSKENIEPRYCYYM